MPDESKVLVQRGNYKFFERGNFKIPYATKPTENSLLYDMDESSLNSSGVIRSGKKQ